MLKVYVIESVSTISIEAAIDTAILEGNCEIKEISIGNQVFSGKVVKLLGKFYFKKTDYRFPELKKYGLIIA